MLDHVREAALILVLENRARIDHKSQLGALFGFVIFADVVAHAVRQYADRHGGIERQRAVDRLVGSFRLRKGGLKCGGKCQRCRRRVERNNTSTIEL